MRARGSLAVRPEALELDYVPRHLIVLGGGYVGLEMAQAYRRFGSRVSIIECGRQLAGREDPDIAAEMQRILATEGIKVFVDTITSALTAASGGRSRRWQKLPQANGRSREPTSWSRLDAVPTPRASASRRRAFNWMLAGTSRSTTACRPARPMSGESENAVQGRRSSRTSRSPISGSFATISQAGTARLGTAWSPIARYAMR